MNKKHLAFFALFVLILGVVLYTTYRAEANPSQIQEDASATATTTIVYLQPSAGIHVNTFDTQADGGFPADSASLMTCITASSTLTALTGRLEYSNDNLTWAQNNLSALATTSPDTAFQAAQTFSWRFASTSLAGDAIGALSNSVCKIMSVPTPTRYIRVAITVSGANGAVWTSFFGKKENR